MNVTSLLAIALGAILTNNFILVKFLGICPFMGGVQKDGHCPGHGRSGHLRHGPGLHGYLGSGLLYPHASGPGVHADCCFHSHHCRHCAGGGDVFEKERAHPVSALGIYLPSSPPTAPYWAWRF